MRRPRFRPSIEMSLFPFLAVLICTMGALIVLLVVIVQNARVEADVIQHSAVEPDREKHQQQIEKLDWELNVLQASREQKQKELSDERLRLSGVEEHIRQLEDELRNLSAKVEAIQNQGLPTDPAADAAKLEQLRAEIVAKRAELEQVRREVAERPRSHMIIPYEGSNGTTRRPIYVECRGKRVILQPEGIELTEQDFRPPLGPGNPLGAALRATREYLAQFNATGDEGEPYPLLIVRPRGAKSYSAARQAMKWWDSEFGYELINEDMNLEFPPADPELVKLLRRTIEAARQRQYQMALAAPARFGRIGTPGDSGASGGGFDLGGSEESWDGGPGEAGGGDSMMGETRSSGTGEIDSSSTAKDGEENESSNDGGRNAPSGQQPGGEPGGTSVTPLAGTRGRNWGLKNAANGAIGFTRTIRLVCFSDRAVILPDRGSTDAPTVVRFEGSTKSAVDELVSGVWKHTGRWGIAGRGSYWKPTLKIEVENGGRRRYDELKTLLEGSGLMIERTTP